MSATRTEIFADTVDLKRFLAEPVLIAAVSGGSDSTALLLLLKQTIDAAQSPARLVAVTVDHGLRPESADEALSVARLCARFGIEHRILRWTGDKPTTALPAAARNARHHLLAECAQELGVRLVLTGHTQDDQAETVIMRQQRGEGIGLAGIAPATLFDDRIWFIRPLLQLRRVALRKYLHHNDVQWIDDPTNENDLFERPRVRKALAGKDGAAAFDAAIALSRRRAADRSALSARAADLIDAHALLEEGPQLELSAALLAHGDRDAAVHALRVLLAVAGGGEHLPDLARATILFDRLAMEKSRFTLARAAIDNRKGDILLRRENRRGSGIAHEEDGSSAFSPPWALFLPVFDIEAARAVARLLGNAPPMALPWP